MVFRGWRMEERYEVLQILEILDFLTRHHLSLGAN